MKKQYEQHCNAAMLEMMGVPVMKKLSQKHLMVLEKWLKSKDRVEVDYPDNAQQIADLIVKNHASSKYVDTLVDSEHYNIFR